MKLLKIFIVILSAVFLTNCKKDNGENGKQSGDIYGKLSTVVNVSGEAAKVFQDTLFQYYDTLRAIHAVGNFLSEHDQIESGYYVNRNMIEFTFKNGLKSSVLFLETDANGNHKYRGGGGSVALKKFSSQKSTVDIKNENVLVLNPYISHFSYPNQSYSSYLPYFEGGNVKLTVTHFDGNDVRLSHINSMDDYGMVILNTHGTENSFSLYDLATLSQPEAEDFTSDKVDDLLKKADNYPMDKFENSELQMGSAFIIDGSTKTIDIMMSVEVTADYIKNSNLDLTDVVVFGNHCFSGFKSPFLPGFSMVEAWESKNVGTYYAYAFDNGMSAPANDDFCRQVEISLIKRLAQDNDTTGVAHLTAQGNRQAQAVYADSVLFGMDISEEKDYNKFQRMLRRNQGTILYPLYLTRFFTGNLKWGCQDSSFTDPRDGEIYKTVKIGNQRWLAENLRYSGVGTEVTDAAQWEAIFKNAFPAGQPAWCYYDNDPLNNATYGKLYNWYAATSGSLCPPGWHLPNDAEWDELVNYLEGYKVAGGKLKSIDKWKTPNVGATNEVCFSALPGGSRGVNGLFNSILYIGAWWSAPNSTGGGSMNRSMYNSNAQITSDANYKTIGYSVRCVMD